MTTSLVIQSVDSGALRAFQHPQLREGQSLQTSRKVLRGRIPAVEIGPTQTRRGQKLLNIRVCVSRQKNLAGGTVS